MHIAAESPQSSAIELLVRLGSNAIDTRNHFSMAPLDFAFGKKINQNVKTLLALGANPTTSSQTLTAEEIESMTRISEDEICEVRYRVYFAQSLLHRLIFQRGVGTELVH